MVRDCFPEEVMVKLKPEDVSAMRRAGKGIPGRGNSQGKGSEVGMCLMCLRNNKESTVAEAE